MQFLWPWALLLVAPWAGLYFLLRRSSGQESAVPFLALWPVVTLPGNQSRRRLIPPFFLLCLWLGLLAAIFAACRPVWTWRGAGLGDEDRPIAIIVDCGLLNSTQVASMEYSFYQQLADSQIPLGRIFGTLRPVDRIGLPGKTVRTNVSQLALKDSVQTRLLPTDIDTTDQLIPAIHSALFSGQYDAVIVLSGWGLTPTQYTVAKQLADTSKVPVAIVPPSEPTQTFAITQFSIRREPAGTLSTMLQVTRHAIGRGASEPPVDLGYEIRADDNSRLHSGILSFGQGRGKIRSGIMVSVSLGQGQTSQPANPQDKPSPLPGITMATAEIFPMNPGQDNLYFDNVACLVRHNAPARLEPRGQLPESINRLIRIYTEHYPPTADSQPLIITNSMNALEDSFAGIVLFDTTPRALTTHSTSQPATSSYNATFPNTADTAATLPGTTPPAAMPPSKITIHPLIAELFSPQEIAAISQAYHRSVSILPANWLPLLSVDSQPVIARSINHPSHLAIAMNEQTFLQSPDQLILWLKMIDQLAGMSDTWTSLPLEKLPPGITQAENPFGQPPGPIPPEMIGLVPGIYHMPNGQRIAAWTPQLFVQPTPESLAWTGELAYRLESAYSMADETASWQELLIRSQLPPVPRPGYRIHLHMPLVFASLLLMAIGAVCWPRGTLTPSGATRTVKGR